MPATARTWPSARPIRHSRGAWFVAGRYRGPRRSFGSLVDRRRRGRQLRGRVARRSFDPRCRGVPAHGRDRRPRPARGGPSSSRRPGGFASSRSRPTRSTARSRRASASRRISLAPRSPYTAAKAAGELLVRAYARRTALDMVITRGANTYGPHQHPEKLIPLFITNALGDEPLPLYGDGLQQRDWLHVDDHADGGGLRARSRRSRRGVQHRRRRVSAPTARSRRRSWASWASPGRSCAACPIGRDTTALRHGRLETRRPGLAPDGGFR